MSREPQQISTRTGTCPDDPDFATLIDDVQTTVPEYESAQPLENGTYYWRVAPLYQSQQFTTWSEVYQFQLIAGWEQLTDIPEGVYQGASMVYIDRPEGESLFVLVGGGSREFYRYHIGEGEWYLEADTTPYDQNNGSYLACTGSNPACIYAVFGEDSPRHAYYDFTVQRWELARSLLPEDLHAGAALAHVPLTEDLPYPYIYLAVGVDTLGQPRDAFYREHVPSDGGGQSASTVWAGNRIRLVDSPAELVLHYYLDSPTHVRIAAYDATGSLVSNLFGGCQASGSRRLAWNRTDAAGKPLSAGSYFIVLSTGTEHNRLKVIVR